MQGHLNGCKQQNWMNISISGQPSNDCSIASRVKGRNQIPAQRCLFFQGRDVGAVTHVTSLTRVFKAGMRAGDISGVTLPLLITPLTDYGKYETVVLH